jgi:predicted TIM-barrel fold metal-dependent hydrolase
MAMRTPATARRGVHAPDDLFDAHLHLIAPDRWRYDWLSSVPDLASRSWDLAAYRSAGEGCGIAGALFMEAVVNPEHAAAEAAWADGICADPGSGVGGWVFGARLEDPGFERAFAAIPRRGLRGIRRVLHVEPDDLSSRPLFLRHLEGLAGGGLVFDLCVLQRQLPLAEALARRFPAMTFVLDHGGNPTREPAGFSAWTDALYRLAGLPNVNCKISGFMGTSPLDASADALRPYVDTIVDAFGWRRVVWGSDWPVCTLRGGSLRKWVGVTRELFEHEPADRRAAVFHGNALRIYGLGEGAA